jgi:hypothetical protein
MEALWTTEHDGLLRRLILEYRWWWFWEAADAITALQASAGGPALPANRNRVMYFAQDRAVRSGLYAELLGDAPTVTCARCGSTFLEPDGRGWDLAYRVDICNECIKAGTWEAKIDNRASREKVVAWIAGLAEILGRVPPASMRNPRAADLAPLDTEHRVRFLDHMAERPGEAIIERRLGPWLNALIAAGVLPDGTRRTSRGTQAMAVDGHVCWSIGEKTIDDFLSASGVAHDREPPYPEGGYRGDFLIDGAIVEYFGLAGDPGYDAKTAEKARICRVAGIRLIELYATDVVDPARLRSKLLDQGMNPERVS